MAGKLALAALLALLAALAAGWLSAHAGDPADSEDPAPLTLHLEADSEVCTAGSFTEVRWEISGGATPYAATLNGEPVDTPPGAATIPCGAALNIPDWLRSIVPPSPIDAELLVRDASGDAARERLTLQAAPPFPARPASLYSRFPDDQLLRLGHETDVRTALGVSVRESRTERAQERRYLVRWRPTGEAEWRYDAFRSPDRSNGWYDDWEYDTGMPGVRFEAQTARVRSFAERVTPDLLNWSDAVYTTTESAPLDLTVQTTHDTIALSWGPTVEELEWFVRVSHTREERNGGWEWETKPVGPNLPYQASYDGLLPDTLYVVDVRPGVGASLYPPVVQLSVRTEPAPPGWTRELRRPQDVQIERQRDGIFVTWDPPAEGPERAYEVYVHEYGAPRSEPIAPATDARRVFSRRAWRYSTSEVIVRHLGVEGAEVSVVLEPVQPSSTALEQTQTMTLPDWQVEHRQSTGYDGCDGYTFAASWDALQEKERLQIRWRKDGYTMTRSAQQLPILICLAEPGPYPFELRLRNEDGFWSQWSSTLWASAKPSPPPLVDVREQIGMLVASWKRPERWYGGDLTDHIDGFRAYLYRAGELEQMLDVGAATRAEFPIPADGGEYEVRVTSYSDEWGEGSASIHTFSQADSPRLQLIDHWSDGWPHVCDPQWELPSVARWFIIGGAAPYTLRVTGGQTFSTNEHAGYIELACDARLESDSSVAEVTVIDAHGRSDAQQVAAVADDLVGMLAEYYADHHTRWPVGGLPFSVEDLAFDGVSVHREALWLSWNKYTNWWDRRFWQFAPSFTVRWKETGSTGWDYRKVDDVGWNWPSSSKWRLGDLTPDTEYEVQIAAYWTEDDLAHPARLTWAESLVARTLPASIPTNVYRKGHDVVVSWTSIPEAWAYQVIINADGASWWKDYRPNGKPLEEAVFRDVPTEFDATLRVNVITPPGSGDGRQKPGFSTYERIWPH